MKPSFQIREARWTNEICIEELDDDGQVQRWVAIWGHEIPELIAKLEDFQVKQALRANMSTAAQSESRP